MKNRLCYKSFNCPQKKIDRKNCQGYNVFKNKIFNSKELHRKKNCLYYKSFNCLPRNKMFSKKKNSQESHISIEKISSLGN